MEINRLGLQALYGATPGASAAGNATGVGATGERGSGRDEAREAAASQPAPSTRVMLSAAGQSMLAAEQQNVEDAQAAARQSAAVPQNMPVQNTGETDRMRNEAASFTAAPPAPAIAQRTSEAVPMQQASTTRPTSTPAPESQAVAATPVAASAPAQPPRDMAPAQPPQAQSASRAESMAQQNRARQDMQAQSRQDVSPMLAQSGLASYRQVLSL
ncbi:hypothetical protein [Azovibrio restrictus]|uniref:hypothetical protein n=1 Tax=Azovibrio restrictus TaxID=146938 RepID=UPI0026F36006|nr:hypothetical protein [Azovibrio restrictus]